MDVKNIRFKAKRLDNGEWMEGEISHFEDTIWIVSIEDNWKCADVDPDTMCMFTGLKDKNGTPIYEGDIVTYKDNNAERRGNIIWDSKATAFCFGQDFLAHYPSENMTVIGNKYD